MTPVDVVDMAYGLVIAERNQYKEEKVILVLPSKYSHMLSEPYSEVVPHKTLKERLLEVEGIKEVVVDPSARGMSLREV